MTRWIARTLALAAMALVGVACLGSPDAEQVGDSTEALVPAPGCFGDLTGCPTGTKTCGAWGAWSSCSDAVCGQYTACAAGGDFGNVCGRSECNFGPGTGDPENRARACTMRASGEACVEYGYQVHFSGCGC